MRRIIITSWRVALVVLVSTGSFAGGGYLPGVGPAALRFKPEPPVVDVEKILPPLAMDDEPVEQAGTGTTDETGGAPLGPLMPVEGPEESPVVVRQQTSGVEAMPDEAEPLPSQNVPLTPQMFMRFFNESGNREAIVEAPVEFRPPAATRGSSATYIVK